MNLKHFRDKYQIYMSKIKIKQVGNKKQEIEIDLHLKKAK
ncbi:hypothetical protein yaldo0001_25520 [Yersinia aldovae ATCC 35236]|nr:hypothetical protein yaldo0001_25520 [Yersinia aldovae ATCC 35236]